jgi:glycosyltransferase involved in cell wall biosynthesis
MKSILFLIPSLGGGGAERVLVNLVNNIDKSKYRVTVQTLFDVGVNRQYLNDGIEYIPGFKKQIPGNTKIFKLFSPKTFYRRIVKKKYDIAVSYLEGPTARIIAGCPYPDTKLISWIHVEQLCKEAASYAFKSYKEASDCYNKYDLTVCVSETVKKDFTSIFDLKNPCKVFYNTNEDSYIRQKGKEKVEDLTFSQDINIVSVGRLRKEKGYDRLINVHKNLLDEGIKNQIYVIGAGSEEHALKAQINACGVDNTFHLIPFKDNPYKYVAIADLFVCSSRREGFSTAVTEALILGIPVVSTECSGAKELLGENNEYGIVVQNSEEGIYEGLKKMLSDPALLKHYKRQAEIRGGFFSKEKTVKAVEDMIDSL